MKDVMAEAEGVVELIKDEKITQPIDKMDNTRSLLYPKAEDADMREVNGTYPIASAKTCL
jgi:hypothetical protein